MPEEVEDRKVNGQTVPHRPTRRTVLEGIALSAGAAGIASTFPSRGRSGADAAGALGREHGDDPALLIDLTKCVGCGLCVFACKDHNGLGWRPDQPAIGPDAVLASTDWTVVQAEGNVGREGWGMGLAPTRGAEPRFAKRQCLHCLEPACVSACPVHAMQKSPAGPVTYDVNRCIGCRYCLVACPFEVPTFDWDSAFGRVSKCNLCDDLTSNGQPTACAQACPTGAVSFGARAERLREAWRRIRSQPDRYVKHVFGETEVGGTSVLYVSDVPFDQLGFRTDLPTTALPNYTWDISRLVPPVAVGLAAGLLALYRRRQKILLEQADPPTRYAAAVEAIAPARSRALARRRWSPRGTTFVLTALAAVGAVAAAYRLRYGLGAATNLSDRWPWGLWVWWDVLTGVALAGGGYSTALLVHFLGKERWRSVERSAFLTSLLGYLMVCAGLFLDLGRWFNAWRILAFWQDNPHSIMTELFWCVGGYTIVQVVEFGYIFVERVRAPRLAAVLAKIYVPVLTIGVILPMLHQSALGSIYVIAKGRLDPLWWSMLLPVFFLLSSFFVGPAMVSLESILSARAHSRRPPIGVLAQMVRLAGVLMAGYLALKVLDLAVRGQVGHLFDGSVQSLLFLLEVGAGVLVPAVMFLVPTTARSPRRLTVAAALAVAGVALGRANVVFTGMAATAGGATYVPSWMEVAVTIGLVAVGILAYRAIVRRFPIYPDEPPPAPVARAPIADGITDPGSEQGRKGATERCVGV